MAQPKVIVTTPRDPSSQPTDMSDIDPRGRSGTCAGVTSGPPAGAEGPQRAREQRRRAAVALFEQLVTRFGQRAIPFEVA